MAGMKLTPLGDVSLGFWISWLLGPSNGVTHTFHNRDYFHRLNIEVVLWETSVISRSIRELDRLGCWPVKGTSVVLKKCSPNLGVRLSGMGSDPSIGWLERLLGTPFLTVIIVG